MLRFAFRNLVRRPLRNGLAVVGLAVAVAVLVCLASFGDGYRRALESELNRMGLQMMLVPLGCPYDAAARILKGKTLENSLPDSALAEARRDPAVEVAAPLLMAALSRPEGGRTDFWVGLDETSLALKPWWRARAGQAWFKGADSVILGADAAEVEMRAPGDYFFSPETGRQFEVVGVLERSGTSDDSLFFVPLATAQRMFQQPGRLTGIAVRLRDPTLLHQASERLQRIPGAQVVTLTEMMGTFLNMVGAVRMLLAAIAMCAIAISVLSVFNTILAAVVERMNELCVMRALGASRGQILGLIATESLVLGAGGGAAGVLLALLAGHQLEHLVKQFVPLAPSQSIMTPSAAILLQSVLLGLGVGLLGGLYPAWKASRLHPVDALKAE
jgi:putative ABC transport system permease protein